MGSTIINRATLVIQSTVKVIEWIDQALQKSKTKKDALQNLRDALICLRDDVEFYQTQLSGGDMTSRLPGWDDHDFIVFEQALGSTRKFLGDITRTLTNGLPSEPELIAYLWQAERHRKKNKMTFKLIWYSLRKDAFSIHHDVYAISHPNDKLAQLKHGPFMIDDSIIPIHLDIVNSDRYFIEQYEEMMRRAGKGWLENRVSIQRSGRIISSSNIDTLKDARNLLFEILWTRALDQWKVPPKSQMDSTIAPPPYSPRGQEPDLASGQRVANDLEILDRKLQASISLARKPTFTTAFCGMAKAGKSLFLNALIGTPILPSDEFPSTAWPCRVRHVEGQREPELQYDQAPFLMALNRLREWKYGSAMKQFNPPLCIDDDTPKDLVRKMNIWVQWNDLHPETKVNLEHFENPRFQLEKSAYGTQSVITLLFQLNDIVRIYQRFGQVFGVGVTDWPLLTLEFPSLRGRKIHGVLEFIDLPGIGEHLQQFENLVNTVTKRSDAIIPIVSLLNMQHDESLRTLPNIINACGLECNAVICTNLDRVNSDYEQRQNSLIAVAFWPQRSAPPKPGIIRCSSLIGISAQALLTQSQNGLPIFQTFWKPNIGYHAAERILGARAERVYKTFNYEDWNEEIMKQVEESRLPSAIEILFNDIVNQARPRVMLQELNYVYRVVCNFTNEYNRILEGARRTEAEYNKAKEGFERDKKSYHRLLCEWKAEEEDTIVTLRQKISHQLRDVEVQANKLILDAIKMAIESRDESGRSRLWGWWSHAKECSDQVWELRVNAHSLDEFLRLSQEKLTISLDKLRIKVTPVIEKLKQEACKERVEALTARITSRAFDRDILKQQIEQNIAYELSSPHFVANVTGSQIHGKIEGHDLLGLVPVSSAAVWGLVTASSPAIIAPVVIGAIGLSSILTRETIRTDKIVEVFQNRIVAPWIKEMKKRDGKMHINAMGPMAESIFATFLTAEEKRFKEELEQLGQPMDQDSLRRIVMIYGNLVATKAALEEIIRRMAACMPSD